MHTHQMERWQHSHSFLGPAHRRNERRTLAVVALTGVMMVIEIAAGTYYGSMALLADGWHMGTHLGALSISALAYWFARRQGDSRAYTFGTGKFGDLAAFTSAVILAIVSLLIGFESVTRLVRPVPIDFDAAIAVAFIGLTVNLVSALLLREEHPAPAGAAHDHAVHDHATHDHPEHGYATHDHAAHDRPAHGYATHDYAAHDHNLRSAFLHVAADALTSVFAIVALAAGRVFGWTWLDPAMGVAGAAVIAAWSYGLLRDSSRALLDREADPQVADHIRADIEAGGSDRVADLHVWRVGPGHFAAILTVVTHEARTPDHYKALLRHHRELSHVTVEVQACA
jgi:cation diffusion facilitator family transporter